MKVFIGSILICIELFAFGYSSGQLSFVVQPIVPSLVSNDHTSEGFLVTLSNGNIIHFFRLDPGSTGDHTGNGGCLAKRMTTDGGISWTSPDTVFNDQYDDRNINGGILTSGRIVLTFRRYDAPNAQHIDYNLIYSDDGGNTWSPRQVLQYYGHSSDCQKFLPYVPGNGYLNLVINKDFVETIFSNNGINWSNPGFTWDYTSNHQFVIDETCITYTKNGILIGLMRNDTDITGANYYQVYSTDYGNNWSQPVHTNMANGFFCPSPLIFYDSITDYVWAIATDRRRNPNQNLNTPINSKIYVYRNKVDSIYNAPTRWILVDSLMRPYPNRYRFYGYPCVTRKANGNFLIVFTESYHAVHERALLYQFEILSQAPVTSLENIDKGGNFFSQNFPNPARNSTSIIFFVQENYKNKNVEIDFFDASGKLYDKFITCKFCKGMNIKEIDLTDFKSGTYFFCFKDGILNNRKKMLVLK